MVERQLSVTFQPDNRSVYVLAGTKIAEAAARAGLIIDMPCGGQATCGKCRVKIDTQTSEPSEADKRLFSKQELAAGWRLACQNCISSDAVIYVPESSRLLGHHKILTETHLFSQTGLSPLVRKLYVELSDDDSDDDEAGLQRLKEAIGDFEIDSNLLAELPGLLSAGDYKGTAVLYDNILIDFEASDTSGESYGVALDIGTTTVAGILVELTTGEEIAVASEMNLQIAFGDDVISRIGCGADSEKCFIDMHNAVMKSAGKLIEQLCEKAGISAQRIYELTVAGNTAMEHLFCRVNPASLAQVPFEPTFFAGEPISAGRLTTAINRRGRIYAFPIIGGFVGGDIVAGIIATNLADEKGNVLFIDIGTNGEIVLAGKGRIWSASTAAGPAFEGAGISCGSRAQTGAIEKIVFDDDIYYSVIGGVEPTGICGSGLIDLAADMLRAGIISPQGRLLGPDELPQDIPSAIAKRLYRNENGKTEFLVARPADDGGETPIVLTERDVRQLQLAAGAIRAGVRIMLKRAGLEVSELDRILIAGGFAGFIRRDNARRIGLLPAEIGHERIQFVGNAALSGAKWALLCRQVKKEAEKLAGKVEYLELAGDKHFQDCFAEAMLFPEQ